MSPTLGEQSTGGLEKARWEGICLIGSQVFCSRGVVQTNGTARDFCLFTQLCACTENKLPTAEQVAKRLSQGRLLGRIVI